MATGCGAGPAAQQSMNTIVLQQIIAYAPEFSGPPGGIGHSGQRASGELRRPAAGRGACHQLQQSSRAQKTLGVSQELTPPAYSAHLTGWVPLQHSVKMFR